MEIEKVKVKPMNSKEIANLYGVSAYVLNEWLRPIRKQLGKQVAKVWNNKQVKFMFEHWGEPTND